MPHNNKLAEPTRAETENPRRTALKQMALLCGLSLSAQSLDVLAATVKGTMPHVTKFFTPEQLQMTGEIADLIIPTTDTPGALAVNVHGFLDKYLAECVSKEKQQQFLDGLKKMNSVAEDKFHKTFLVLHFRSRYALWSLSILCCHLPKKSVLFRLHLY